MKAQLSRKITKKKDTEEKKRRKRKKFAGNKERNPLVTSEARHNARRPRNLKQNQSEKKSLKPQVGQEKKGGGGVFQRQNISKSIHLEMDTNRR